MSTGRRFLLRSQLIPDKHDMVMFFLLGIFLYQFVVWFDFYWHEATRGLVTAALFWTFLWRTLISKTVWLRILVIVGSILYSANGMLDIEISARAGAGKFAALWTFLEFILKAAPFLWFAFGASILYVAIHSYLSTKWRIFSFLAFSVVLFCIVDSFSLFSLWDQVAIMIGCGLVMLAIDHFRQFKRKDPEGYSNLMSYPLQLIIMVVTIISASILLGVLAPSIRPLIMDPYTAWKTYQGEPVQAFSSGPGFITFNTANAMSGYSRDDSVLGGAFNYDYSTVFTVDTTRRSYYRGETRSRYTGRGWEETAFDRRDVVALQESPVSPDEAVQVTGLEHIEVYQTFHIAENRFFPVLFGAAYAQRVDPGTLEGEEVDLGLWLWNKKDNSVFRPGFINNLPYPRSYMVTSYVPVIDEEKLKLSEPIEDRETFAEYLQLPGSLPQRVADLAREVTAAASTPYEKAKALENYLSLNFTYTNTPDVSKGQSDDFVDSFLFEIMEGYCDYFSTAMVIMARTLDLPARWVKGYTSGQSEDQLIFEQYLQGEELDLNGPGTYTVRNADAHSWVEIYFAGIGWIPFEPTAGFSLPVVAPENETLPDLETVMPTDSETAAAGGNGGGSMVWIAVAGASAAAAGLVVFLSIRFQWFTLLRTRSFRMSPNYNLKLLADVERLLVRFRRKGLNWSEHETFREMMLRWMKQYSWLQSDMEALLYIFEKAKYSGVGLTEEEYHNAEQRIRKLREIL